MGRPGTTFAAPITPHNALTPARARYLDCWTGMGRERFIGRLAHLINDNLIVSKVNCYQVHLRFHGKLTFLLDKM